MSSIQNRGGWRVRYRPVTAISVAHIRQMFALHLQHDPHASLDDFIHSLCTKSGAVLATHPGSGKVLGHAIVSITHMVFDGQRVTGVFSEPCLHDATRDALDAADAMGEALFDELVRMHLAHPLTRLVWLTRADDAASGHGLRAHCRHLHTPEPANPQDATARLAQAFGRRLFAQQAERRRPALLMGEIDAPGIMVCLTTRPWRWFRRNILRNYRAVKPRVARQPNIPPQQATWQDSEATEALERGETS